VARPPSTMVECKQLLQSLTHGQAQVELLK
jgi:hypothetical protein